MQSQPIFERKETLLYKNIKIFLNYFLGPLLFLWLSWSVWQQLRDQPELGKHLRAIHNSIGAGKGWTFWIVLLLMPLNWGLETAKWRMLLKPLCRIGFSQAFRAILSGVAFSLNTPNRVGEYGGRLLHLPEGVRIQSVSVTVMSGFSQLLVTLIAGSLGLTALAPYVSRAYPMQSFTVWYASLEVLVFFISALALLVYFRMIWFLRVLEKIPTISKLLKPVAILEQLDNRSLLLGLLYSACRYAVFVLQYTLILDLMGVSMNWNEALMSISALFLLLAVVPSVALLELGLRWEYSIVLFSLFDTNTVGMYAASTAIWLINLVLPAAAGSLFILGVRVFRTDGKADPSV